MVLSNAHLILGRDGPFQCSFAFVLVVCYCCVLWSKWTRWRLFGQFPIREAIFPVSHEFLWCSCCTIPMYTELVFFAVPSVFFNVSVLLERHLHLLFIAISCSFVHAWLRHHLCFLSGCGLFFWCFSDVVFCLFIQGDVLFTLFFVGWSWSYSPFSHKLDCWAKTSIIWP